MSACAHALTHSTVFYIVTSMQELQSSLTAFCAFNTEQKSIKSIKGYIAFVCFSELIVQVLVRVWYLTFNKASVFAKRRISECVLWCCICVCVWDGYSWAESSICWWKDHNIKSAGVINEQMQRGLDKRTTLCGSNISRMTFNCSAPCVRESLKWPPKVTCWERKETWTAFHSRQQVESW